jgi:hypothetical protein
MFFDGYFNIFSMTHGKLIDTVINDLLDQNINTIIVRRAIAQFPDIHTRAKPDVFLPVERPDAFFVIISSSVHNAGANINQSKKGSYAAKDKL